LDIEAFLREARLGRAERLPMAHRYLFLIPVAARRYLRADDELPSPVHPTG
jgi:hypothetical protein